MQQNFLTASVNLYLIMDLGTKIFFKLFVLFLAPNQVRGKLQKRTPDLHRDRRQNMHLKRIAKIYLHSVTKNDGQPYVKNKSKYFSF
jgi:hypothetical protein